MKKSFIAVMFLIVASYAHGMEKEELKKTDSLSLHDRGPRTKIKRKHPTYILPIADGYETDIDESEPAEPRKVESCRPCSERNAIKSILRWAKRHPLAVGCVGYCVLVAPLLTAYAYSWITSR